MSSIKPLTRKQRLSIVCSDKRVNVWEGAVRSSKTICSIIRWIRYIKEAPAGHLLMVGKTERTLKRNIIDVIVDMLGHKRARYIAGKGEFWVMGRMIYIAGANDESAQEKIRGLTLAGAYGDEISIWPESFWTMLLSRLSIPGSKFFGTTNPDNPVHWLKKQLDRVACHLDRDGKVHRRNVGKRTRKGKVLNWSRLTFKLRDNPNLEEEYLQSLESEYTGLWYRRFILGEWVAAEGAIYQTFDEQRHIVDELPPMQRILSWGIDYGSTNPTAGVLIGVGVDNRVYCMAEWAPKLSITDGELSTSFARQVKANKAADYVFTDPSAKSFRLQLHKDRVHPRVKLANNDVDDGIRFVASLLANDRLRFHRSCAHLLDEAPGYVWDPDKTAQGKDEPLKVNDHYCDAMRYGIYTPHVLIENVIRQPISEEWRNHAARSENRVAA